MAVLTALEPLKSAGGSAAQKATVTVAAVLGFSVASYIEIPMSPVPITAQTYAFMVAAILLGWRLGLLATVGWLAIGAAGVPVLAGGASGLAHFTGPAAGYLVAFPLAVVVVALLAERGWNSRHLLLAFMAMALGHLICLTVGGAWLASDIGVGPALRSGVLPYLPGGIIKSVLGVATIAVVQQVRSALRH